MAKAKLNFNDKTLKKGTGVFELYSRLYEGMKSASQVDVPKFDDPPLTPDGQIDTIAIDKELSEYSDILSKNSAYLFATSIMSVMSGGDMGAAVGGFVSRSGDSMSGALAANYGFSAGSDGEKIIETDKEKNGLRKLHVYGDLDVDGKIISKNGIEFSENAVINIDGEKKISGSKESLNIASEKVDISGSVALNGSLRIGDIVFDKNGVKLGDHDFYHTGNANKANIDWNMHNSNVSNDLTVDGSSVFRSVACFNGGIRVNDGEYEYLYTNTSKDGTRSVKIVSDIDIAHDKSLLVDNKAVLYMRTQAPGVLSLSSPGLVLNLGDGGTKNISLQSDIKTFNNAYTIVSKYGDGYFKNSFKAGAGNAGDVLIQTFSNSNGSGVLIPKQIVFENEYGPSIDSINNKIRLRTIHSGKNYGVLISSNEKNTEIESASRNFLFLKPIESQCFKIKSNKYQTRLIENALFLNESIFIEGLTDGMRFSGNSRFDGDIGSVEFASGFAGYGWSIKKDKTDGNIRATFDDITVRRKMRIYEMDVQKNKLTNGSLWVSDSCSGDEVRIIQ